ncbi:TPA_exp: Uncharacterized protein A8136_0427 [Trichophyton benhamiae CBS 112371]|uniref:Uncharacterized protein n=1 Tax=Arthroderma benhamiae (strain ATCC MYA-4681 / CBS 112371) TaxID=663331 RepID=D4AJI0_ARTBC|nr:uncharacterized protein ARB_04430 [Trichophyton benhamiae CBS 112371]EFE36903.1 hypothetical protein ARB_04430 [Trichophyton benhamiae CBS 112371]DAA79654.1 TPA_exp: Uncharacterized protein A8136_0427 [Trichophyton benhamiae CBS 112371]
MAPKIHRSLQTLMAYIKQSKNRRATILRGQGIPGHRAAPAKGGNHDAKIGSRIDVGEIIKKAGKDYRRYKFQLNLNAEDSTLKKMAAQDSHLVYSTADVEIRSDRTEEEEEEAIQKFEQEMFQNLKY